MDTDAKKMTTFLADHPVTFPVVRDAGQKVAKSAKIPAMPTTVIVGKDGVIREIHAGFTVKDGPAKLTAAIDQALKEAGK
jgi:peroxiredoxin